MNPNNSAKICFTSFFIILTYGLIIAMFVYSHKWAFKTSPKNHTWEQPTLVNNKTLISSDNYRIRFNSIEKEYYNIEVGDDGNLVIDADTGHALESASGHIPLVATAQEITRFTMLINRMHPYIDNQQLSELTLTYRDYLYELDKSLSHEKSQKETHQALLYKKQLQEKYFGKQTAKKLFGIKSKVLPEKLKIDNNNQSI